ncbi:serine/threonine-protein kinase MARK2 [Drosophila pseudoobscura]|uniref:Serine/threonine-protein kinase par-1 n=1 Tax=Drosophila pseudoobscura pseudoobscura TaxID=46245 RepID=A0A6I8US88_DROPS|nr:serine/threonine-protein kinase MARK2 [Drosophila pseudoobscura]
MSDENSFGIIDFSLVCESAASASAASAAAGKAPLEREQTKGFTLSDKENCGDTTVIDTPTITTTGATAQPATRSSTLGATARSVGAAKAAPAAGKDVGDSMTSGSDLKFQSYVNGNGNGVYKIVKTLGKGNFAKVKLAVHIPTGREVAIKVIDKTQLNTSARQKLYREVRIMKLLNHPNIVRLFQVIESERSLYLVMEYASRGELFDHLVKHGRMRERDARVIFRQLVSAIQYCHSKFVVHRDLKAENLLLDQHMNIKIADFGFGNTFDPNAQLETFCGSPPYAAPELFMGRKYAGPEVDAWSLGVVLYTLVSGSLPFDGGTLKELRERVLRGKYRVPYYISMDCENLMRKFLVLNPAKRTTLNAVMGDKWINLGHEEADKLRVYREKPMELQDPARVDLLVGMGHKRSDVEQSVRGQLFDDIYCTYMLLNVAKPRSKGSSSTELSGSSGGSGSGSGTATATATASPQTAVTPAPAVAPSAASRPTGPRMANILSSLTTTTIPATEAPAARTGTAVAPAKPTRRTPARKGTAAAVRSENSSRTRSPHTPQSNKRGAGGGVEVKPTLLSAQRQMAQTQKMSAATPPRFQYLRETHSPVQTPGSARRPTTLYEKADLATPPTPTTATATPMVVPKSPAIGHRLMERLDAASEKPFTRQNAARATFHFGQGRSGKNGRGGTGMGADDDQTPPLSADDTKPASRVGFFSKLTARFGRRVIHLNEKDVAEQRKNLTK